MADKKFTIKEKTAAGYDRLFPKTTAEQVYMENGETVAQAVEALKAASGSQGGAGQMSAAYSELKTLRAESKLKSGTQYLLTDYVTKYRMPYVNVIKETPLDGGSNERLLLTATSGNTFSPVAASLDYPQDVIYYDFDDNVCEDGTTTRNGFIQRRIDTKYLIDVPHDWRTMVWARLKATAQTWASGAVKRRNMYQSGTNLYMAIKAGTPESATDANYFLLICASGEYFWTGGMTLTGLTLDKTDYAERYTFNAATSLTKTDAAKSATICPEKFVIESASLKSHVQLKGLHNNVFYFSTESDKPRMNWFAPSCFNNTFGSGCYGNTFGAYCYENTFGSGGCNNNFGSYCYNNLFKNSCSAFTFGSYCYDNTFAQGCGSIVLSPECSGNIMGSNCYQNTFSVYCLNNTFKGSCQNNIFGANCSSNIFLTSCSNNTFGANSYSNVTGASFSANTFGSDCRNNKFGDLCSSNSFSSGVINNTFGNSFQYNFLEPYITGKNMSDISELHAKTYNHRIFKNSLNAVFSLHYDDTSPVYTPIP